MNAMKIKMNRKLIEINGKRFCKKGYLVETLFDDRTADGEFEIVAHGIRFYDLAGKLFAFACCGPQQTGMLVTATKKQNGIRYMFCLAEWGEKIPGLDSISYSECRAIESALLEFYQKG